MFQFQQILGEEFQRYRDAARSRVLYPVLYLVLSDCCSTSTGGWRSTRRRLRSGDERTANCFGSRKEGIREEEAGQRRRFPASSILIPSSLLPKRLAVYLGNACSISAAMYAITAIAATQRWTSAGSSLSGVSASVW